MILAVIGKLGTMRELEEGSGTKEMIFLGKNK